MKSWGIVGRLVWKELRESWLVLTTIYLVPLAAYLAIHTVALTRTVESESPFEYFDLIADVGTKLETAVQLVIPVLVVLWAARKANERRQANSVRACLPVSVASMRLADYWMPLVLTGLAGAWTAMWFVRIGMLRFQPPPDYLQASIHTGYPFKQQMESFLATQESTIVAWGLLLAACFALAYLLSLAFTRWSAVFVAGLVAVLVSSLALSRITSSAVFLSQYAGKSRTDVIAGLLLGAVVGLVVYDRCSGARFGVRRAIVAILLVLFAAVPIMPATLPVLGRINSIRAKVMNPMLTEYSQQKEWSNGSKLIASPLKGQGFIIKQYSPTGKIQRERLIRGSVFLMKGEQSSVYLAHQAPDSNLTRILLWHRDKPEMEEVVTMRTGELLPVQGVDFDVIRSHVPEISFSPDSRYLLMQITSRAGVNMDIWYIDLRAGRSRLVAPNVSLKTNRQWSDRCVTLSGIGDIIKVDRKTLEVETVTIPHATGGCLYE